MKKLKNNALSDREIIFNVLYESLIEGRYSNDLLRRVESEHIAFITDSVYGVIERQLTFKNILKKFSKLKDSKIENDVRVLIYMGMYHLLYTNVKEYAAIYEVVELAKKKLHSGAASFVNGILRRVQREKLNLLKNIDNASLDIKYSISNDFLTLLKDSYNDLEIADILRNSLLVPMVHIYIRKNKSNIVKLLRDNEIEFIDKEDFLLIKSYNHKLLIDYFNRGDFTILDYSTSVIREALDNMGNIEVNNVIDLCAAPGGKTLLVSDYLSAPKMVSQDINDIRVSLLMKNIATWKLNNVIAKLSDATEYDGGKYDLVISDVPCSGSGVFRRRPEIKYKVSKKEINELNVIQKNILSSAYKYTKDDGFIIYSTCSILKDENENILDYAIKKYGLKLIFKKTFVITEEHEGFFVSLLKKVK